MYKQKQLIKKEKIIREKKYKWKITEKGEIRKEKTKERKRIINKTKIQ